MHVFLETLEKLLHRNGRKRPWLAEQTGVSLSTINSWYAADRPPKVELAFRIAQVMEVSIETLLTGKELPQKRFDNAVLSRLVRYLETKDHDSLMKIEGILLALAYVDLAELVEKNIADKITGGAVNGALGAILVSMNRENRE